MKRAGWARWKTVAALGERKSVWAGLVVAALAGGTVLGSLIHQGGKPLPASVAPSRSAQAIPKPAQEDAHSFRVTVPSIGVNAPVVDAGSTGAGGGELNVPSDIHTVAWWDGLWKSGSSTVREKVASPGQPGVALLAGHVDSAAEGPGVFYRLDVVKPGAIVTVTDQNKVTKWKVTRVETVNKNALPTGLFANTGKPQLALVSCGGPFDDSAGHYVDNIIAWTTPAS